VATLSCVCRGGGVMAARGQVMVLMVVVPAWPRAPYHRVTMYSMGVVPA
jgi:hypothetical protein